MILILFIITLVLTGCFPKSLFNSNKSNRKVNSIGYSAYPNKGTVLTGYIFDENQNPLYGASIQFLDDSIGALADETGFFKITNIPEGLDTFKVACIGYQVYYFKVRISYDSLYVLDTIILKEYISPLPRTITMLDTKYKTEY